MTTKKPPKQRKRTTTLNVRLTSVEMRTLKRDAEREGVNYSEWVRRLIRAGSRMELHLQVKGEPTSWSPSRQLRELQRDAETTLRRRRRQ